MNKKYQNIKQENLKDVAEEVFNLLKDFFEKNKRACVLFLKGDLGAGKTTFTKELGKLLKIKEDIISPTFILRKDYENMIHVDGYRFSNPEEGKSLALDIELDKKDKVIVIEWPERFVNAINLKPDFTISFEHKSEYERDIFVEIH